MREVCACKHKEKESTPGLALIKCVNSDVEEIGGRWVMMTDRKRWGSARSGTCGVLLVLIGKQRYASERDKVSARCQRSMADALLRSKQWAVSVFVCVCVCAYVHVPELSP